MAAYKFTSEPAGDSTIQIDSGQILEIPSTSQAGATGVSGKVKVLVFYPYFEALIDLTANTILINTIDITANGVAAIVNQLNEEVFVGVSVSADDVTETETREFVTPSQKTSWTDKATVASPVFTTQITTPKLLITEGSNGNAGQTTLVNGTVAITIAGLTTSGRAFVTRVVASGTTLSIGIIVVCTTNTLTITATVAAGTINTSDGSTYNYFVIN